MLGSPYAFPWAWMDTLDCSPDLMGRCQSVRFADWKDTSMRAIMLLQDSSVNPCVFRSLSGGMEKGEELLSGSWGPCPSPTSGMSSSRLFTTVLRTFLSSSAQISMS